MTKMLSAKDIKEALNIGINQARRLMESEGFPSIKLNKRRMVSEKAFDEWVKKYQGKEFVF